MYAGNLGLLTFELANKTRNYNMILKLKLMKKHTFNNPIIIISINDTFDMFFCYPLTINHNTGKRQEKEYSHSIHHCWKIYTNIRRKWFKRKFFQLSINRGKWWVNIIFKIFLFFSSFIFMQMSYTYLIKCSLFLRHRMKSSW